MKSTKLIQPSLEDAFDIGRREGLKEAFTEIKAMIGSSDVRDTMMIAYVNARLKSILDFSSNNPFKQKDS